MGRKTDISVRIDPECENTQILIVTGKKTEKIDRIIKAIRQCEDGEDSKITVYDGDKIVMLDRKDITRVYIENRKLTVCTAQGSYLSRMVLRDFEEMLDDEMFVRISRFEIVNLKKAVSFDISIAGTIGITFEDGSETWVARRCVKSIQEKLKTINRRGGVRNE